MGKFRVSSRLRQIISERAGGCCEYCRSPEFYSPQTFSIEHVIPVALQGEHSIDNLAFSCQGCNVLKGKKTTCIDALTGETVPVYNPRKQIWNEHFIWDESWQFVIGITSIGRATTTLLQLNRPYIINLRKLLITAGEHPPLE